MAGAKPFRLLDLPLELQRKIFEKAHDEPFTLKGEKSCAGGISWHGAPSINLLCTCRQVFAQALPYYRQSFKSLDIEGLNLNRIKQFVLIKDRMWMLDTVAHLRVEFYDDVTTLGRVRSKLTKITLVDHCYTFDRAIKISSKQLAERHFNRSAKRYLEYEQWRYESIIDGLSRHSTPTLLHNIRLEVIASSAFRSRNDTDTYLLTCKYLARLQESDTVFANTEFDELERRIVKRPDKVEPCEKIRDAFQSVVDEIRNLRGTLPPERSGWDPTRWWNELGENGQVYNP